MSVLIVFVEAFVFLCSVYFFQESRTGNRNDPSIILYRLFTGGIATLLCTLISFHYNSNLFDTWYSLDFSCLSVSYLYLGQLMLDLYQGRRGPDLSLSTLRDLVFGPVYEEIVFRGAMIPLLNTKFLKILISSLVFGLCHIHHGLLEYLRGNNTLRDSVFICMFQFTYTFIFGLVSSYYFVKTGSIVGVIMLHSICNYFGVPDFDVTAKDQKILFWTGTLMGFLIFLYS